MKNIVYQIDFYLLGRFQLVADWTQEWFGVNNFKLSKIFLYIYVVLTFLLIFITFTHGGMKKVFQEELTNIYMITSFYIGARTAIFYLESMKSNGVRLNHVIFFLNKKMSIVRVISVVMIFLLIIYIPHKDYKENYQKIYTFIEISSLVFLISVFYFIFCDSGDSGKKSRIRKFIEKTKESVDLLGDLKLKQQHSK